MTRRLLLAVCLAWAAAGAAGAGWAGRAATVTFSTNGDVEAIAADGLRVAVATSNPSGCDSVSVWTAGTKSSQSFESKNACEGGVLQGIPEIAIAGTRVAWVATTGGNELEMYLESARLGTPKVSVVASAVNDDGAAGGIDGNWLGNLYGDGSLLVFNTWYACAVVRPIGDPPCAAGTRAGSEIDSRQTLWKLSALRKTRVAAGAGAFAVIAVSGGRIAVENPADGGVSILDSGGHPVSTAAITAGTGSGTAFDGAQVVTLRNGVLQAYNASSGHLDASVSLPSGGAPFLRDLQGGLAVYVRGRQIHVVRLADGKDATFVAPGKGAVDAQIEPAGLTYSYNVVRSKAHGRVVFVPTADLQAKLG